MIANDKKNTECFGCFNISKRTFPFRVVQGEICIDTEHCAVIPPQDDDTSLTYVQYMVIHNCPVCGMKIKKSKGGDDPC